MIIKYMINCSTTNHDPRLKTLFVSWNIATDCKTVSTCWGNYCNRKSSVFTTVVLLLAWTTHPMMFPSDLAWRSPGRLHGHPGQQLPVEQRKVTELARSRQHSRTFGFPNRLADSNLLEKMALYLSDSWFGLLEVSFTGKPGVRAAKLIIILN